MLYEFEGDKTLLISFYSVLFLIGISLISLAVKRSREVSYFLSTGTTTKAVVREILKIEDSEGHSYKPVFEFTDKSGNTFEFENASSSIVVWKRGEEVSIVYDPDDPKKASVISYWDLYSTPVLLFMIGSPFIIFSLGYFSFLYYLKSL